MNHLLRLNKSFLDPKQCYELWIKQRISIYKIPEKLTNSGVINPYTGQPPTPQAIWRAAWLYILEHPETSKRDAVSILGQYGQILNEEEWNQELLNKARQFLNKKAYNRYLIKYPHLKKYE